MTTKSETWSAPRLGPGYTVDPDGRLNVYAIEPEMYIKEPGDLRLQRIAEKMERHHELEALQADETGQLTVEHDLRHKGPGIL